MEPRVLRSGFRQIISSCRAPFMQTHVYRPRRFYATPAGDQIRAAAELDLHENRTAQEEEGEGEGEYEGQPHISSRLRIVPASPSYFTGKPTFTDDLLDLEALLRKYLSLPTLPPGQAPRVAWKTIIQYNSQTEEAVRSSRFTRLIKVLQRLNYIHPSLMPEEVRTALDKWMRNVQPFTNTTKPGYVDQYGRARAIGRRKSSHAIVYLVEGEGDVLINGKSLSQSFARIHDRESAIWALKATERVDKYNVWALVRGGGCTGQAEALTLGVAKALLLHEPALKAALRRGESDRVP